MCGIFCNGNYMAVLGDRPYEFNLPVDHNRFPSRRLAHLQGNKAAFGIGVSRGFKDFVDGTSNSLLLGEYLTGTGDPSDQRGWIWQDEAGSSHIMTMNTPNSSAPDWIFPGWCINVPENNLPCVEETNEMVAARSQHPGGVQVVTDN